MKFKYKEFKLMVLKYWILQWGFDYGWTLSHKREKEAKENKIEIRTLTYDGAKEKIQNFKKRRK